MEDLKIYLLTGALTVVGGILAWIVTNAIKQAMRKLDEMVEGIKTLTVSMGRHEQEIMHLQEANTSSNQRMNNHSDRLRDLEKDVAVLKSK